MRFPKLLAMIAAVGASVVGAWHLGSALGDRRANTTRPALQVIEGLAVATSVLDRGEIWETKDYSLDLPIQNRTNRDVAIRDLSVSCSCIGVEPRSLSIPASETKVVHLTIDLAKRAPWEKHVGRRPMQLAVAPVIEGKKQAQASWTIRGVILSRVTLDTDFLEFGQQPVENGPPVTRKIEAVTHVPASSLQVSVTPPPDRCSGGFPGGSTKPLPVASHAAHKSPPRSVQM